MRCATCVAFFLVAGLVPLAARAQAPDVAQLAAGLTAAQPQQQYAAADALADLGPAAKPAVSALVAALASSDSELRWRAARALGTIGDAAALDALRKAGEDADALVRAQAIFALGRLKAADEPSLRVIVGRLSDKEAQVRRASVRALRMIEAPRTTTIPLVVKLLEDADATVAMRALHSIAEAGVEVVPALSAALERPEARYWACLALAELGAQAKDAVPGLIQVLDDERPEVRMQAAIALAEVGSAAKPAAGALIKRANDPVLPVAVATVFALGRVADPAAAEALAKAQQASDPTLKMLATWALAKIHPGDAQREQAAIEMLVKGLADKDIHVAAMAARALEDLNPDPVKVRPLVDSPTQNNPEIAERVINAFATLGARAVPHAITALKEPQRRVRALQVLARIGPEAAGAVPTLVELLKTGDAATRAEVLRTLAAIGPGAKAAVESITAALDDSEPEVQQTAAYALGKIGPDAKSAIPGLTRLASMDDEVLRLTAIWAILRIGPRTPEVVKSAVPVLTKALLSEREFVRIEAAQSLGELGASARDALPALEAARQDKSEAVRSAVEAALKKIR